MSHRALSPQQFDLAQVAGLHPSLGGTKVPDVIHGRTAQHVMNQADIRQTRRAPGQMLAMSKRQHVEHVDAPHIAGVTQGYGESRGYPYGEVWTSQAHLHVPTLKHYMQHGPPENDPDYGDEDPIPYEPETYHHGGKQWIAEGHHRIVANRLS
jgi:hypothetical protein